jgi:Na+-driven multidrug efflux pump
VLSLFCSDPAVVSRCLGVLPALSCLVVLDGANAALSGVLRGCGRQKLGAAVNFVGFVSGPGAGAWGRALARRAAPPRGVGFLGGG